MKVSLNSAQTKQKSPVSNVISLRPNMKYLIALYTKMDVQRQNV